MKKVLCLLLVGIAAVAANAGVEMTYNIQQVGDNAKVTFNLVGTGGSQPAGFDGTFTTSASFVQNLFFDNPTPNLDYQGVAGWTYDNDTCFLWKSSQYNAGRALNETSSLLDGGFAVLVANRTDPLPLAQIIVPWGASIYIDGEASVAGGALTDVSGTVLTPEPATMTLLASGLALAALKRRKR